MALAETLYFEIYEKLDDYLHRLRQSRFKMEAAFNAYEAKCKAKDRELKAAVLENSHRQSHIEAEIALAGINETAEAAKESVKKASEALVSLKKEVEKIKEKYEADMMLLEREFKLSQNRYKNEAYKLKNEVGEYLDSLEIKRFAFIINSDRALYDNAVLHQKEGLNGTDYISIGMFRAPIPVHEEFVSKLTALFNDNFDAATKTIMLPACIDMKRGQSIVVEYLPGNAEQDMILGIRNFVLNTSRYFGAGLSDKRELLLFQNFPENYDAKQINNIRSLCMEASDKGNIIILTHNSALKNVEALDTFTFIKSISTNIGSKMGGFFMEMSTRKEIASFKWYSSPETLADKNVKEEPDCNACSGNVAVYIEAERDNLLHNIITTIVKNTHPDDIELWLIDFGKIEFGRYVKAVPPHVRYLICEDSEAIIYDIIDRIADVINKRQNIFKDNGWTAFGDVSYEKYMPLVVVMINETDVMLQAVNKNTDYVEKLGFILKRAEESGFRFILSGKGKHEGYEKFAKNTALHIWHRDEGKLLLKDVKLSPLCIMDEAKQKELIHSVKAGLTEMDSYDAEDEKVFIDKRPLIIDGNKYVSFESMKMYMKEYLKRQKGEAFFIFPGEVQKMSAGSVYPVAVEREAFENLALIVNNTENDEAAAAVIISVFESIKLQNAGFEIWGSIRSRVFKALQGCVSEDVFAARNIDDIREQIRIVKKDIMAQKRADRFIVLIGFETLLNMPEGVYREIYDAAADIRFVLTYGPQLGYHFVMVFNKIYEFENVGIPKTVFRHKLTFRSDNRLFVYNNETDCEVSFKPYLFEGLSWDGWSVLADGGITYTAGKEEYLL